MQIMNDDNLLQFYIIVLFMSLYFSSIATNEVDICVTLYIILRKRRRIYLCFQVKLNIKILLLLLL